MPPATNTEPATCAKPSVKIGCFKWRSVLSNQDTVGDILTFDIPARIVDLLSLIPDSLWSLRITIIYDNDMMMIRLLRHAKRSSAGFAHVAGRFVMSQVASRC